EGTTPPDSPHPPPARRTGRALRPRLPGTWRELEALANERDDTRREEELSPHSSPFTTGRVTLSPEVADLGPYTRRVSRAHEVRRGLPEDRWCVFIEAADLLPGARAGRGGMEAPVRGRA